ncbi:hypothetical protein AB4037_08695 [Labrys sp. KB_33_2]|uniref:hypothetical protein n=1 Tax=Labrys sp. KB_33_2 TaxID=3237479 RepID=UPI003F8ED3E1
MTNIINFTAPQAPFSRLVKDLMDRIQAGGLYWHIIIPDEAHRERLIPPDLSFGLIPPNIPPQDALDAAAELREIWYSDSAMRVKMIQWHAERGLLHEKLPMTDPSTWSEGGVA